VMDIRAEVDVVARTLPDAAEDPIVMTFGTDDFMPMLSVNLSSYLPEKEVKKICENLRDDILEVDNVSKAELTGLREREIWIEVDPGRMSALNVTFDEVIAAVGLKNLNVPGGTLKAAESEFIIRTIGEINSPEEINDIIVRTNPNGGKIKVKNVAEVKDTYEDWPVLSRLNRKPVVTISVSKKAEGNSIKIIQTIRGLVSEYQERYGTDVTFTLTNDTSIHINKIIKILQSNAVAGLILVIILLWLFLGGRNALLAAIGIPITFLFAFLFMYMTDRSLNGNSIFGLVLVLGMVVDDAVVVIENCHRYIKMGYHPKKAAIIGAGEVGRPIVSSIATTIAAFLPLVLLPGIMGKFMQIIPIVVSLVLLASLFEAFVILPAHIADWTKVKTNNDRVRKRDRLYNKFRFSYLKYLKKALRKRYWVVAGVFVLFVISMSAIPFIGVDLFADDDYGIFFVHVEMPADYKLEATDRVVSYLEDIAAGLPEDEVEAIIASSGMMQTDTDWIFRSNVGQLLVDLVEVENRTRSQTEIMDDLRERIGKIPGVKNLNLMLMSTGPPTGKAVEVKVKGKYFDELEVVAERVKAELRNMPGVRDITDDFELGKNELKIKIDDEKAALLGVNTASIASGIRNAYFGIKTSVFRDGDDDIDVIVKFSQGSRENIDVFNNIKVAANTGRYIPLKNVASIFLERGYANINRFEGERVITVFADVDQSVTSPVEVNNKLIENFKDINKEFPGYRLDFRGEFKEFMESLNSLGILFAFGILLIYIILGSQFKSFVQPIMIIFTIPFAFIGAIVGLIIARSPFSIATLYGIVALAGVAVNSSIVLIDFINRNRFSGKSKWRSIIEAGFIRIRPIFLTTATTVFGLFPMAFGIGGKSIVWAPLASTIMFGLIFSSTLTLFAMPCIYAIFDDIKRRLFKKSANGLLEKHRVLDRETQTD
ncbi:efflux RND transporter permease subunit, partial [candidate division KSB1 bacterium]